MAEEAETESKMSASEKKKEDWMNSKWRPMMGWMYMGVCSFDFVLAPVMWSLLQSLSHGSVQTQWQPLTLQGAGLFHIAMGAVLGIAAHGRTQEKLNGANNGGLGAGTTYTPPAPINSGGFGNATPPTTVTNSGGSQPPGGGFGSSASTGGFGSSSGFGAGTSGFDSTVASANPAVNAKGQKVVPPASFPEI
jgi:hypothetical protein